jgi:cob(I)alamin adenosyltransferase
VTIVTKTGDDGMTGLYGTPRVPKSSPRIHAVGNIDELNALLGLVLAAHQHADAERASLERVQQLLFRVGSDLATPLASEATVPRVEDKHVEELETWIKKIEPTLPAQTQFILPGGSHAASLLHVARAVCRRAERWMAALAQAEPTNPAALRFMNRLGDWLFLAARARNLTDGGTERLVTYE